MKKLLLTLTLLLTLGLAASAETITEVLTQSNFSLTNAYSDNTYTSPTTGIAYAINACKTQNSVESGKGMQFRSSSSKSGLVITSNTNNLVFKSIKFEACSGTTTNNTIDVYGKNIAYTEPSDLFDTSNAGTSIGSVAQNAGTLVEAEDNYGFIGFRSNNGTVYIKTITITYETASATSEISADKINITANGETIEAEDVELYAGTELTFSYADPIEGVVLSYSTDADTYTPATSYVFIPGEDGEVSIFVKAEFEEQSVEKALSITKKAVATPVFSVEGGDVAEGSIIKVYGENVEWNVAKDGGEAEAISGDSYPVNDVIGTALTFTATASVTLNGITTDAEPATLNVTVAEKPFEPVTVEEWQLVTSESDLAAGDKLIIAYTTGNVAMSTEESTNNRKEISVTISNGVLTYSTAEVHKPLILELGGESGKWTFETLNYEGTNGYFACATGDSKNYLLINADGMTASISIAESSDATIKFDTDIDSPRNQIKYNSDANNGHIFSCYKTAQKDVQIYKLVKKELHPEVAEFTHNGVAVKGVSATLDYVLHVANHAPGAKYNVTLTFTPETGDAVTASNDVHTIVVEDAPAAAPARETAMTKLSGTVATAELAPKTAYAVKAEITVNGKTEEPKVVELPSITTNTTGIEDVMVEGNEAAEYYNLQGVRVAEPQAGQVYIVRRGAKATKELVK